MAETERSRIDVLQGRIHRYREEIADTIRLADYDNKLAEGSLMNIGHLVADIGELRALMDIEREKKKRARQRKEIS